MIIQSIIDLIEFKNYNQYINNMEEQIVYQLTIEDMQIIANEYLDRNLNEKEISLVTAKLGDCINWSEAIQNAIILALSKSNN